MNSANQILFAAREVKAPPSRVPRGPQHACCCNIPAQGPAVHSRGWPSLTGPSVCTAAFSDEDKGVCQEVPLP